MADTLPAWLARAPITRGRDWMGPGQHSWCKLVRGPKDIDLSRQGAFAFIGDFVDFEQRIRLPASHFLLVASRDDLDNDQRLLLCNAGDNQIRLMDVDRFLPAQPPSLFAVVATDWSLPPGVWSKHSRNETWRMALAAWLLLAGRVPWADLTGAAATAPITAYAPPPIDKPRGRLKLTLQHRPAALTAAPKATDEDVPEPLPLKRYLAGNPLLEALDLGEPADEFNTDP